jgi:lipopolysaccharide export system permease protein
MKIIDRYIGGELFVSLVLGLGIATFVLLTKPMLKLMDLLVTKLVPVDIIARLFLYTLPPLFVLTTPMALLLAVIATYSRLAADQELTALKAAGCSLYRLSLPAFAIGIGAILFTAFNTIYGVPWAGQAFRDLVFDLTRTRATIGIEERVFNDDFHGLIFYANHVEEANGWMEGIFVVDTQDEKRPRIITARRGRVIPDEQQNVVHLDLQDGSTHVVSRDKTGGYQLLKFQNLDLALSVSDATTVASKDEDPRTMTIPDLIATIQERAARGQPTEELRVSFHQRFAAPLACLVFILLGTPLAARVRRSGKGISVGLTIVLAFIYYILMVFGQAMGKNGILPPFWASWLPNLVLGGLGVFLFVGGNHESWLPLLLARRKGQTLTAKRPIMQ